MENMMVSSPRTTTTSSSSSHRGGGGHSSSIEEENALMEEGYLWRVEGPVTLHPGINEVLFTPKSLPPPSTYVFEKLGATWGGMVLEQDHLVVLDADTLEAAQGTNRPLRRRLASYSRQPSKQAVSFTVIPRPPSTTIQALNYPIMPPDTTKDHQVVVVVDTHRDTVSTPVLTITQRPTTALAPGEHVSLRFFATTAGE